MTFPLKRIYVFDKWYPLNTQTMNLGFGFGLAYPKDIQDTYQLYTHDGWDWPVPEGEPIYAVADGEIQDVVDSAEWGKGIWQDIGGKLVMYWHNSRNDVVIGQNIKEGQVIGLTGKSGKATGPHLHFGLFENGSFVNPLTLFTMTINQEELNQIYLAVFGRLPDDAAQGYVGHELSFVLTELMKSPEYQAYAEVLEAIQHRFDVRV